MPRGIRWRLIGACLAPLLIACACYAQSQLLADGVSPKGFEGAAGPFPSAEKLSYEIEWRLIYAGTAVLTLTPKPNDAHKWDTHLQIDSAGMVSKLYTIQDTYDVAMDNGFCTAVTHLDEIEGKRHRDTKVVYDHSHGKAVLVERDLHKNTVIKNSEVDIPACTLDALSGLNKLRADKLEPGQSVQVPMSDGKRTASVRVVAQDREEVKTKAGTFDTIRYQIYLFNGALYPRKADLFVWLTNDQHRLPVQIRARMNFPVGTITLELAKDEHP